MKVVFDAGYSVIRDLRRAAAEAGAGEAEVAAIDRLERFTAELVDLARLAPLARLVGLDWEALYPEVADTKQGGPR